MKEQQLNQFGMEPLKPQNFFVYGLGNFASQLSWTMVSTYLSIFYTDVFGLSVSAVALLMLVAKIWDGVNDPMMGTIMERTHTKWGRFRPYICIGAPLLVVFTILTFTVPGFSDTGKLAYAYITYIGLGMAYTMTNVPYLALPVVMTRDPKEINKLNAAQMMGMTVGQIVLNLSVLPLVKFIGGATRRTDTRRRRRSLHSLRFRCFWQWRHCQKRKLRLRRKTRARSVRA